MLKMSIIEMDSSIITEIDEKLKTSNIEVNSIFFEIFYF